MVVVIACYKVVGELDLGRGSGLCIEPAATGVASLHHS
jgi:hypothetical protein